MDSFGAYKMAIGTYLAGWVRSIQPTNYGDGTEALVAINNRGDVCVSQSLSPYAEGVRLGDTWQTGHATASAFTNVAAMPTTRAELVLFNGEPALGGKSYVIESVSFLSLTSIAAAAAVTIVAQVVGSGTAPADDTAQLITSQSGRPTYGGRARRAIANTAFAVANKWQVLAADSSAGPAASIGFSVRSQVDGQLIVPPGGILCLNTVVGTAVGTSLLQVVWSERQIVVG